MVRSSRNILIAILLGLGVLAGLGLYTVHYAEGLSYLSNDPRACTNCHVMQEHYQSWIKSSHRLAATCNDCHVPHDFVGKWVNKALNGFHHSKAFTLQDFPEAIRIRTRNLEILEENCADCHASTLAEIHAYQRPEPGAMRCTVCHGSVGHMSLP